MPTNSKVFLRGLLNMREKQILTSVIEIQKENRGNHFSTIINQQYYFVNSFKTQSKV